MAYKKNQPNKTGLKINTSYEGETIEQKINRIVNNKEPIKDGAPQIYTDRKDGVIPEYDIRTDRFEQAVEGMSELHARHLNTREERMGERTWDTMNEDQQKTFKTKYPNNKLSQTPKDSGTEPAASTNK